MLLVDTNIAINLRDADEKAVQWLASQTEDTAISLITLVELQGGLAKWAALSFARCRGLADLLDFFVVLPFDRQIVNVCGQIVREIGFLRPRILDRLIAATALVHDRRLTTNNPSDFRDIPGLKLELWTPTQ